MTLLKKAAALFVAAALSVGSISARAENSLIDIGGTGDTDTRQETVLIQTEDSSESAQAAETGETSEEQENTPQSGVDLSDTEYKPIDISGFTEWDGKTKMQEGVNYYITESVRPRKNFAVPAGSTFVVCSGAELVVYKGRSFGVRGNMISEPDSKVTVSGRLTIYSGAGYECYGDFSATKSSLVRVQSEFVLRHNANATFSGQFNIYKDGLYLNYGQTSLTSNSVTKITGEMQTPVDGRLLCKGYIGITINGRSTQAGFFSLTGEFVNSGVFIFESTVRFYKAKTARFAVSKSSRLIDYRNNTGGASDDDQDDELGNTTDIGIKGIDVSYAQGAVNWKEVKSAGIEFAMIRASRGAVNGRPMAKDTTFDYNITEATKNGIKVGVYHYLYAKTEKEARKEAKFFIKTIAPYKITYPVVLDIEEEYQAALGKKKVTNIVKAFLEEIKDAGYYAMLYSNKAWLTDKLDMSRLSEYDVWLAQWNTVPTYKGDFGMWQYSCKGIVSGIEGYVDLNLSYKNYSQIIREGNYNKLS